MESTLSNELEFEPAPITFTQGLSHLLYVAVLYSKDLQYQLKQNSEWEAYLLSEKSKGGSSSIQEFSQESKDYLGICLGQGAIDYTKISSYQNQLQEAIMKHIDTQELPNLRFRLVSQVVMG